MTETTPNRPWSWLRRKITVFNYLLLTLPMFVIAVVLAAVTHSDLPYNIWAVLWATPLLIVLTLRWVYFVVTLAWAIGVEIFQAVRNRFARPD